MELECLSLSEAISSILKDNKQDKFLKHLNQLNKTQKEFLLEQLNNIDFKKVADVFNNSNALEIFYEKFIENLEAISYDQIDYDIAKMNSDCLKYYETLGLNAISNGEVAILLLAGGISSRLSITYPKGMFSIDLLSNKSLFQLQAEKLIRLKKLSNEINRNKKNKCSIPWYIMTSSFTHQATFEHFEGNNYFGLNKDDVVFFEQNTMPLLSNDGNLILDENLILAQAPCGTDSLYDALIERNILNNMKDRGIKHVHIYCIENCLVKLGDPVFTGICIKNKIDSGVKIAKKFHSREPISPLYTQKTDKNNKHIIDFSIANKYSNLFIKKQSNFGDIGYYFKSLNLLENICRKKVNKLEFFHKINHRGTFLDDNGLKHKQFCIKFEKFLTDRFPEDFKIIMVNRKEEFSPLKYIVKSEHYTKLYCKHDLINLHYNWFLNAGARFHYPGRPHKEIKCIYGRNDESNVDDLPDICEISPLVSYNGENLEDFVRGKSFEPPIVLDLDLERNQVTFNGMDYNEYIKSYPIDIKK